MKQRHFMPLLAASLALAACQPESPADLAGGLLLNIESTTSAGAKPAVDGIATTWLDGDIITLNGAERTVSVSGNAAKVLSVTAPRSGEHWFATSPAGLCPAPEGAGDFWWEPSLAVGDPVAFSYPREYTSSLDGEGRQVTAFPMVAVADSNATSLTFRHLAAAVQVQVETPMLTPIRVDSVVLVAASACLNGAASFTVDPSSHELTVAAPTDANPDYARRSVCLDCTGANHYVYFVTTLRLQLPVPPLPAGEELTVLVYGSTLDPLANYDNDENKFAMRDSPQFGDVNEYVFSHSAALAYPLERTHLISAHAEVRPDGHLLDSERSISRISLFSLSATKKVRFKRNQSSLTANTPLGNFFMPTSTELEYLLFHRQQGARYVRVCFEESYYMIIFPDGHTAESVRALPGMDVLAENGFNIGQIQTIERMTEGRFTDFINKCHQQGFAVLNFGRNAASTGNNNSYAYRLDGQRGSWLFFNGTSNIEPSTIWEYYLCILPLING